MESKSFLSFMAQLNSFEGFRSTLPGPSPKNSHPPKKINTWKMTFPFRVHPIFRSYIVILLSRGCLYINPTSHPSEVAISKSRNRVKNTLSPLSATFRKHGRFQNGVHRGIVIFITGNLLVDDNANPLKSGGDLEPVPVETPMCFSNGPVGRVDGNVDGKVVFVSSIWRWESWLIRC